MSFAIKEFNRLAGKALHSFNMIQDGDRVLVGLSGGKDSLALLMLLHERLPRVPIDYRLVAVHLDMGYESATDRDRLADFVDGLDVEKHFEATQYGPMAHQEGAGENPLLSVFPMAAQEAFRTGQGLQLRQGCLGTSPRRLEFDPFNEYIL